MSDELRERLIVRILRMPSNCAGGGTAVDQFERRDIVAAFRRSRIAGRESTMHAAYPVPHPKDWPRAPMHRLSDLGTFIVTTGTLHKEHWFRGPERLDLLESALLRILKRQGWQLEAWAVFSNHYHFVANAESGAEPLSPVLKQLHGETSREVNLLDARRRRYGITSGIPN